MNTFLDVILTNEIEAWLITQGATVVKSEDGPFFTKDGWKEATPDVYFSGRKIYFYTSPERFARIFFNDSTRGSAYIFMIKWPKNIVSSNFVKEIA